MGENGLFNKAKEVKEQYTEATAREKLETALMEAAVEREKNRDYNNAEFLNELLKTNQIEVIGANVIVDNYNFVIDREKLIIVKNLGKTQITVTKEVQKYLGKNEKDKYVANTLIIIESNIEIENITFINPDKTEITVIEDNRKDINMEFDEEYKIKVKTKDGKEETRTLIESSKENIKSEKDLVSFRNRVNSGLTYEGKTLILTKDLDLSSVCGENVNGEKISWEPIGNASNTFMGIFDGNNKTISKLYISTNENYQGLFGYATGTIKNLIIDDSNIQATDHIGSVIAMPSNNAILENIHTTKSVNVTSTGSEGYVGGIASVSGSQNVTIKKCSNCATVNSNGPHTGGIIGVITGTVSESYNTGNIIAGNAVGGIAGINYLTAQINDCYNKGSVNRK